MAQFVLTHGVAGLERGEGEPAVIVVSNEATRPTFDDMLAAEFVRELSKGKKLSSAAGAFARYAALSREGLQPGEVAMEASMEGIFLAIRNQAGRTLTDPAVADRFVSDWDRMAALILEAIDAGKDPFTTALYADGPAFARERAYLRKDQEVYRQDVQRGERLVVRIPGGPPQSSAIVLREPKSLLWKFWSRRDPQAPVGGAYILSAVDWGNGQWAFSTDPVQRLPIKDLAEELQNVEQRTDPVHAARDPWFDGQPFGHTLVAGPKSGTKLNDFEVLSVFKRWAKARNAEEPRQWSMLRRVAVAAFAIAGTTILTQMVVMGVQRFTAAPAPAPAVVPDQPASQPAQQNAQQNALAVARGSAFLKADRHKVRTAGLGVPGFAVVIGVGEPQDGNRLGRLDASVRDAVRFYKLLRDQYGFKPENMVLLVDQPQMAVEADGQSIATKVPTFENVRNAIQNIATLTSSIYQGDRSRFVFYYAGHGDVRPYATDTGFMVLSGYDSKRPIETGYFMDNLSSFLSSVISSTHQMLIVDCCHAGYLSARGEAEIAKASEIYEKWGERSRTILAAATASQSSYENKRTGEALFTSSVFRGLDADPATGKARADRDEDDIVTEAELAAYVTQQVGAMASLLGKEQTPVYTVGEKDNGLGQFLFIPTNIVTQLDTTRPIQPNKESK